MIPRKSANLLITVVMLASLLMGSAGRATAAPTSPVDESKVPHYFGPYPNWANSPFTLPDAVVQISPPNDPNGTQATAEATVGANGAITGITITDPGSGYSNAHVDITNADGTNTSAKADASIVKKGAVVAVTVGQPGSGYISPTVSFSSNGPGGGASATAYGGVENNIQVSVPGFGYQFPTVDFDMPDGPDGVQAKGHATMWPDGSIEMIVVDDPGSGYSTAPGVTLRDGTLADPVNPGPGFVAAQIGPTSLSIQSIALDSFGSDYNNPPDVIISDAAGSGATATAALDNGIISAITLKDPGTGYLIPGMRKFVDTLPGLTSAGANNLGQYIPLGVPDQTTFVDNPATLNLNEAADYYEIGVVEYTEQMHSDLPPTKLRGYVQLETNVVQGDPNNPNSHYPLPGGKFGVDKPHFLGPTIIAQRDRPVRITFYNLLPTGVAGDLFLPVDSTIMGSGEAAMEMPYNPVPEGGGDVMDMVRNPHCTDKSMRGMCFTDNRATLHLHGGNVPWISDGTPHQWITPADEGINTMWPEGVSVESVPDMVGQAAIDAGIPDCSGPTDGCQTFYYTNQQSARLMFYHDHSWGITRLNVYAGEAAGYVITDPVEQSLFGPGGPYAGLGEGIPLVIQDRTFVPSAEQLAWQDPTWDVARWGGMGNLWYHHVYMPAQNPGDPGGMSAFGRWMYGPWFWPPAGDVKHGPIANPYFGKDPEGPDGIRYTADDWTTFLTVPCSLDDPATWQYQEDPFCEPEMIPGTPNISVGMEQFNDTPIVNGTAYPTVTLEPKTYRFRMLNAANDRFFNFQWYVADATTASSGLTDWGAAIGGTEVALKADEVAAAQLDPVVFPRPDLNLSPAGPDWIHFGTESGFLPKPVVVDGQQVTTWITDPTRFDVGNVDQHSLLLAPAERADVIVDFSQFAGQTLILYNDAPAAFPARIPSYDYYTGAPDLSPVGAPTILPGYGPNTRTIMQVKIAGPAAPAFNVSQFQAKFTHKADGSGVFEAGQHPIIVGQAAYNSAYGTNFAASGYCSSPSATNRCDGFVRINQQGGDLFTFDTLKGAINGTWAKLAIKLEPKAIHDEMNSTNFDEFGRMQATLGVEVVPATPGLQNVVLSPYVFPTTELIDTTSLPKADVTVTPIATADDGTQIWKITHNGVDTHPIHFHATDVQLLNRVTWDNIIIPPDATELGWKETVRIAPLEDTIVAMRPATPTLPFDFPNSIRLLSPMMVEGQAIDLSSVKDPAGLGMTAFAPNGDPIDVYNHYVNFGAEYVYHCHILSHEEMDMMHAVLFAFPPVAPSGLTFNAGALSWIDNSRSETAFVVEKSQDGGISWTEVGRIDRPLLPGAGSTTGDVESFTDLAWAMGDQYRVVAQNVVGDTWDYADPNLNEIVEGGFPTVTATAVSEALAVTPPPEPPLDPSDLTATLETGPQVSLTWTDNAADETGFVIERSDNLGPFVQLALAPAFVGTGPVLPPYVDATVLPGNTYDYRVAAVNAGGPSNYATLVAPVTIPGPQAPVAPDQPVASWEPGPPPSINFAWADNSLDEAGFLIQRSSDGGVNFSDLASVVANVETYDDFTVLGGYTYTYRVAAFNANGTSAWTDWTVPEATAAVPADATPPAAPSNLSVSNVTQTSLTLNWQDNSNNELGFTVQRATNSAFTRNLVINGVGPDVNFYDFTGLKRNTQYFFRVLAFNNFNGGAGPFPWSPTLNVTTPR